MSQTRRTAGVRILRTSKRFATSSVWRPETPVTLLPGCASLLTIPAPTGSPTSVNTIGTLFVASFAACVAASWLVKIRSTPLLTSASAAAGIASSFPSVKRISNVTSRPSTKPSALSPALSPSTVGWLAAHAALRTPTRNGRGASCASAVCVGIQRRIATATQKRRGDLNDRPDLGVRCNFTALALRQSPVARLDRHELMVGAFRGVIPGAHQRLELREGRVHPPGHGGLLRFFPDDLGRHLPELPQHRKGELAHLDLAAELRLESPERERVLRVEVGEAIYLDCRSSMVERPPQVDRERVVCLLVEPELGRGAGLVPARIVVIPCGLVEAQLHVVMRPDPFGGVDHAPLESGVGLGDREENRRAARFDIDLAAEARTNAHLESLVVADRVDLLPEPSGHLRGKPRARARHEVEGGVRLFPELESVTLVVPGHHTLRVHAERDGREPLDCWLFRSPVVRGSHERLDGALRGGVEAAERLHDLAAREDLDPEPPAAHLIDDPRQLLGRALDHVEHRGPSRGQSPLDLRLRDDVGSIDDGRRGDGRHRPAGCRDKPASFDHHLTSPRRELMVGGPSAT